MLLQKACEALLSKKIIKAMFLPAQIYDLCNQTACLKQTQKCQRSSRWRCFVLLSVQDRRSQLNSMQHSLEEHDYCYYACKKNIYIYIHAL